MIWFGFPSDEAQHLSDFDGHNVSVIFQNDDFLLSLSLVGLIIFLFFNAILWRFNHLFLLFGLLESNLSSFKVSFLFLFIYFIRILMKVMRLWCLLRRIEVNNFLRYFMIPVLWKVHEGIIVARRYMNAIQRIFHKLWFKLLLVELIKTSTYNYDNQITAFSSKCEQFIGFSVSYILWDCKTDRLSLLL